MKKTIAVLIFVQIISLFFTNARAQAEAGKFGFGVAVQQPSLALAGRYWMLKDIAIDARFGFRTNGQDIFVIGGSLLKTLGGAEKVYPYFGGRLDIINIDQLGDDTTVSLGAMLGAEYFVANRFSVVGESQFSIDFDGGTSVGTQATLAVLFYFK